MFFIGGALQSLHIPTGKRASTISTAVLEPGLTMSTRQVATFPLAWFTQFWQLATLHRNHLMKASVVQTLEFQTSWWKNRRRQEKGEAMGPSRNSGGEGNYLHICINICINENQVYKKYLIFFFQTTNKLTTVYFFCLQAAINMAGEKSLICLCNFLLILHSRPGFALFFIMAIV